MKTRFDCQSDIQGYWIVYTSGPLGQWDYISFKNVVWC